MFLARGVCEKDKPGDVMQSILAKGETRGGNHGFINSISI